MSIAISGMKEQSMTLISGYRRLREIREGNGFVTTEALTASPAVIVGALALEIGFKFFICKEKRLFEVTELKRELSSNNGNAIHPGERHSLTLLFRKLSEPKQASFRSGYRSPPYAVTAFSGENSFMLIYNDMRSANRTFDDELTRIKYIFVKFRYRYEHSLEANLSFMDFMVATLCALLLADDTEITPNTNIRPNTDPVEGR